MSYFLIRTTEALITPPGLMFMLILAGFVIGSRFVRLGRTLIIAGLVLLVISSLPVTSRLVTTLLESDPPISPAGLSNAKAGAIVILGGGRYPGFEYGKETVSTAALERLRYGAFLHRQTGLPILVSGGSVKGEITPEAALMAMTLATAFQAPTKWIEGQSRNTWENANLSWQLLRTHQISHIVLVTHASHMTRAKIAFIRQGFKVIPAPLGYQSRARLSARDFIPNAQAMASLQRACHEFIGRLWYSIRY